MSSASDTNSTTKNVSLRTIMSSRAFLQGFKDVMDGRWTDLMDLPLEQWRYERGRMFAVWLRTKGEVIERLNIKRGRWVREEFVRAYVKAKKEGALI